MTMIALEQARQHLETTLGLKQAVEALDNTLDAAANKHLTYAEVLAQLLGLEATARRERYLTTKTRMAHLPFLRTLEQFDFSFQLSIDERQSLPPCRRGSGSWPIWPSWPKPATSSSSSAHPGRGQDPLGRGIGSHGYRARPGGLLCPCLRLDGRPEEGPGRAQPGPQDESLSGSQGTRRG